MVQINVSEWAIEKLVEIISGVLEPIAQIFYLAKFPNFFFDISWNLNSQNLAGCTMLPTIMSQNGLVMIVS